MANEQNQPEFDLIQTFYHHMITKCGWGFYAHIGIFQASERISYHVIKEAFTTVVQKQEILQMKFMNVPDNKFKFIRSDRVSDIDMEVKPLTFLTDWVHFCRKSLDQIDIENGHLWKLFYLPVDSERKETEFPFDFVLVFVSHHGIADATSVFDLLYRQFLPVLSALVNHSDTSDVLPFIPMLEPAEVIFKVNADIPDRLSLYDRLMKQVSSWKNRSFGGIKARPLLKFKEDASLPPKEELRAKLPEGKFSSTLNAFFLNEDLTSSIITSAKRHTVTVQSILLAANSLALCKTSKLAGVTLPKKIVQLWPVDLRKYTQIKSPHPLSALVGVSSTVTDNRTEMSEQEFWSVSESICSGIKDNTAGEKAAKFLDFYKYTKFEFLKSHPSVVMNATGLCRLGGVSNVGNFDLGPDPRLTEGPFKVKLVEQYFDMPQTAPTEIAYTFLDLSTYKGKMMCNATGNPLLVSEHFNQVYIETFQKILEMFCKL